MRLIKRIMLVSIGTLTLSLHADESFKEAHEAGVKKLGRKEYAEALQDFIRAGELASGPDEKGTALKHQIISNFQLNTREGDEKAAELAETVLEGEYHHAIKATARHYLAAAAYRQNRLDKTLEVVGDQLRDEKASPANKIFAKTYQGHCSSRKKEYEKARAFYAEVLEMEGVDETLKGTINYYIGNCFRTEKKYAEAIQTYEQVVANEKTDKNILSGAKLHIGLCYHYQKDFDNARKAFQEVIAINQEPGHVEKAKEHLGKLPKSVESEK